MHRGGGNALSNTMQRKRVPMYAGPPGDFEEYEARVIVLAHAKVNGNDGDGAKALGIHLLVALIGAWEAVQPLCAKEELSRLSGGIGGWTRVGL